jgi:hypothetical protein
MHWTFQRVAVVKIAGLLLKAYGLPEGVPYRRVLEAQANAWRELAFGIVELTCDVELEEVSS